MMGGMKKGWSSGKGEAVMDLGSWQHLVGASWTTVGQLALFFIVTIVMVIVIGILIISITILIIRCALRKS